MRVLKVIAEWPDMKFKLGEEVICPKGMVIIPNKSGNQYDHNPIDPDNYPHLFAVVLESESPMDVELNSIPMLSTRARIAINAEIGSLSRPVTISDAASIPIESYKRIRNLGVKTIDEIISVARSFGFEMR